MSIPTNVPIADLRDLYIASLQAMDNDRLKVDELRTISHRVIKALDRATRAADMAMAQSPDEACLPGGQWQCYDDKETPTACRELDAAALPVIRAIRSGESFKMIKQLLQKVTATQSQWCHCGAADTEGREAIFTMIDRACKGTDFDPEEVWKRCYCH